MSNESSTGLGCGKGKSEEGGEAPQLSPSPLCKYSKKFLHNNDRITQKKGIEIHETTQNIADADRIWTLRDTTNIAVDIIAESYYQMSIRAGGAILLLMGVEKIAR